jgi:hypothetical protein
MPSSLPSTATLHVVVRAGFSISAHGNGGWCGSEADTLDSRAKWTFRRNYESHCSPGFDNRVHAQVVADSQDGNHQCSQRESHRQRADRDDFSIARRSSRWCGVMPHVETGGKTCAWKWKQRGTLGMQLLKCGIQPSGRTHRRSFRLRQRLAGFPDARFNVLLQI